MQRPFNLLISSVLPRIAAYPRLVVGAVLSLTLGSAVNLLIPAAIGYGADPSRWEWLENSLPLAIGTLAILFLLQAVTTNLRVRCFNTLAHRTVADLRRELFSSILARDQSFFDTHRPGDLTSRVSSDCALFFEVIAFKLSVVLRYSVQATGGILLMAYHSLFLTSVVALVLPAIVALSIILGRRLKQASRRQQDEVGAATVVAEESFAGIKTVRALTAERTEIERFSTAINRVLARGIERTSASATLQSTVTLLMNGAICVVLALGVHLVQEGTLSVGGLVSFLLYGAVVAVSFAFLAGAVAELQQSSGGMARVFELLQVPSEGLDGVPFPSEGDLLLEQVSFAYPSRPEAVVLDRCSMRFPRGASVAIVGGSGAGKTTLVSLLLRLYYPQSGLIRVGETALASIALPDLRRAIAFVPQEPVLFSVSLRENITFGLPEVSEDALRRAVVAAQLEEVERLLPQGLDTLVGAKGAQLSGGQRQRVAIARALLRQPKFLILDEATAALDSEREERLYANISSLLPESGLIIIAHRLSTARHASRIVLLDSGTATATGSHEELLAHSSQYRRWVELQDVG